MEERVAPAAHTWVGGADTSGSWSNAANWSVGGAVTPGEHVTLTFPAGSTHTTSTDDVAVIIDTSFGSNAVSFSSGTTTNYTIHINAATSLQGPVQQSNSGTDILDTSNFSTLTLSGDTAVTTSNSSSNLQLAIPLAGSSALSANGSGTLVLGGNNSSYSGAVSVNGGNLDISANNALGDTSQGTTVAAGASLFFQAGVTYSTAEPVTLNGGGTLGSTFPNGTDSFAGPITNLGTAATPGNISPAPNNPLILTGGISSSLAGGAGLNFTGGGDVTLNTRGISNSAGTGSVTVTVNNSSTVHLNVASPYTGTTTINGGGTVYVSVDGALGASGTGNETILMGSSNLILTGGFNYFTPESIIDTGGPADFWSQNGNNSFAGPITINFNLDIQSLTSGNQFTVSGLITTNGAFENLTLDGNGDTLVTGKITGPGGVSTSGHAVTLSNVVDDFTGGATVGFTLFVTGNLTASSANVVAGGILGGTGSVQGMTVHGTLAPGVNGIGTITTTSLDFSGIGGTYAVDLNNSSSDRTVVTTGAVSISTLNPVQLSLNLLTPLSLGATYTIIQKQSAGAVSGNFSGLPEGSTFTVSGTTFRITYKGGAGNDVVLTVTGVQPATHFQVRPATFNLVAGTPCQVTVTALDAGNMPAAYSGTVHFTSSDGAALLPADSTLTAGTGTFSVTLKTAGNQTVTATDTVTSSLTGSTSAITVTVVASQFLVSVPAGVTAGTGFNFTVTAQDAFHNTAATYSGTVHFTSSDSAAVLPANAALINGIGTFSATLQTAGNQTLTATDTQNSSMTGTSNATAVSAGAASHFAVVAPAGAVAQLPVRFTVTALDAFNNTATGYGGLVHFTSSDGAATLPANSTLSSGKGTFTATLRTVGNQSLTATDTVTGSITGSSASIAVDALDHFAVSAPSTATAGTAFSFTITAQNASNNTLASYNGTVHFTSSDGTALVPVNSTLVNGVGTFSATLKTAGNQTLSANDTVLTSVTGSSGTITVGAAAANHLTVSISASATAGSAISFTVTALDPYNNTASGYSGSVHFTSTDGSAQLPANSPLTGGVGTFSATLQTAGNWTLTATDTASSSITGTSGTISVSPAAANHFMVSVPPSATAGSAINFTVTALDPYNNTASGYSGSVHFTTTAASATLPSDSPLTNGVGTFSATLKSAGNQTLTATDTASSSIIGTSGTIAVSAAAATHFAVGAPASATAGTGFNLTVTAQDAFNNTATGYGGLVHFTSTDGAAILPSNGSLSNGVGTFSATLKTAANQTLTATDTGSSSVTGTSGSIAVSAGAATHLAVSVPGTTTAGSSINVLVTALDQFNNTATGYGGLVRFTSSDGQAQLPGNSTLTSGVGTFSAALETVGTRTITATDTQTGSITGTSNSSAVSPAGASHFTVSAPAAAVAQFALNFSVTALDPYNNLAAGYTGTVRFTSSDGAATLPGNSTLTNGKGTFTATLHTVGNQTLTATDTTTSSITGTSSSIAVDAIDHFALSASPTATAGTAFNYTVTVQDASNQTVANYSGTVHFSSSDGAAVLSGNTTLSNGVGTFSATLRTSGNQTLSVNDTLLNSVTGTSGTITVAAAAATHLVVSAPGSATAGSGFNIVVTAQDQFNNTATSYGGQVHFTSSDGSAGLPANGSLSNGVGTFSVTLKTAGSQSLTATDTASSSITGTSSNILVSAAGASHFLVNGPLTATAGLSFIFKVTAQDPFNNTASSYSGLVHFSSSDGLAVLPGDSSLSNGVATLSATLKTAGGQTLTATDTASSSITGSSSAIPVSPAAATHLVVSTPASASAGTAFTFTVTAQDAFNNLATGYGGLVHFSSTDGAALLPVNSLLSNGVGTFSATLKTAGNRTLTATDTVSNSTTGTSNAINVSPGAASHFTISAPASTTAGIAVSLTVTALDPFNNTAIGYGGTIHFTSNDGQAILPANSPLSSGVGTFSATLKTAGNRTLTATDTTSGSVTGTSNSLTVSAAAATHLALSASSTPTAGSPFAFTVIAQDPFNNTAPSYAGTIHVTTSDGAASLPANKTLTNGVGTFSVTFQTIGNQTLTATDTLTSSLTGTSGPLAVAVPPAPPPTFIGTGVQSGSVAFDAQHRIVQAVVFSSGQLWVYDSAGAHFIGGFILSASIAFNPQGQEIIDVVFASNQLWSYDATGAHFIGNSVESVSVSFDSQGRQVTAAVFVGGGLYVFDAMGSRFLAPNVQSVSLATDSQGQQVLDLVYTDNTWYQFDTAGAHFLGSGLEAVGLTFNRYGQRVLDAVFTSSDLWQY